MNLDNRIKFRHLACFLEVARQRSFAKAADAVAVSQPAISKTLKELEEILGARLFERSKAGAELTEAGVTFLRYAGPCVQALRDGVNTLRGHEAQVETVRVGVLSTVESLVVPEVIRRLHRRHGALVVSVATGPSAYLLAQLKVGELDLVVGRMTDSPDIQGLTFEHLYSESMMLVVRPGHPLLAAPSATRSGWPNSRWYCRWPAPPSAATPTACSCNGASRSPDSAWKPSRRPSAAAMCCAARRSGWRRAMPCAWTSAMASWPSWTWVSANRAVRSGCATTRPCRCHWGRNGSARCCARWPPSCTDEA